MKIAFATSHERIIKMDNDNNHMQEKVTNTYMHIYSYGLNMVGFWIRVGVKKPNEAYRGEMGRVELRE